MSPVRRYYLRRDLTGGGLVVIPVLAASRALTHADCQDCVAFLSSRSQLAMP